MVDALEGGAVEIEDVLAAVDVGGAQRKLEDGACAEGEFAFDAKVESVVGWQASLVDFGVVEGIFAVLLGVVGDNGLREDQPFEDALGLGEGESRTEGPAAAEFPFALFAEGVGGQQVDGISSLRSTYPSE